MPNFATATAHLVVATNVVWLPPGPHFSESVELLGNQTQLLSSNTGVLATETAWRPLAQWRIPAHREAPIDI